MQVKTEDLRELVNRYIEDQEVIIKRQLEAERKLRDGLVGLGLTPEEADKKVEQIAGFIDQWLENKGGVLE